MQEMNMEKQPSQKSRLANLQPELLEQILLHTSRYSRHLCLFLCKDIYIVAARMPLYDEINLKCGTSALALLQNVQNDPIKGSYIRDLAVVWRRGFSVDYQSSLPHQEDVEETELITTASERSMMSTCLLLLLPHMHNLQRLETHSWPLTLHSQFELSLASRHRLREVVFKIGCEDYEGEWRWDVAASAISTLPLRHLCCWNLRHASVLPSPRAMLHLKQISAVRNTLQKLSLINCTTAAFPETVLETTGDTLEVLSVSNLLYWDLPIFDVVETITDLCKNLSELTIYTSVNYGMRVPHDWLLSLSKLVLLACSGNFLPDGSLKNLPPKLATLKLLHGPSINFSQLVHLVQTSESLRSLTINHHMFDELQRLQLQEEVCHSVEARCTCILMMFL